MPGAASQTLAMSDQDRKTDQPPTIDDQTANKGQQHMRCQKTAELRIKVTITNVAARGTPDADPTDDSNRLAALGNNPSRATLNSSRAPIMIVAMIALKMASTTPALNACAAQGPIASDTKVAKGAGACQHGGQVARADQSPRSPTRPWRTLRSSRRR